MPAPQTAPDRDLITDSLRTRFAAARGLGLEQPPVLLGYRGAELVAAMVYPPPRSHADSLLASALLARRPDTLIWVFDAFPQKSGSDDHDADASVDDLGQALFVIAVSAHDLTGALTWVHRYSEYSRTIFFSEQCPDPIDSSSPMLEHLQNLFAYTSIVDLFDDGSVPHEPSLPPVPAVFRRSEGTLPGTVPLDARWQISDALGFDALELDQVLLFLAVDQNDKEFTELLARLRAGLHR